VAQQLDQFSICYVSGHVSSNNSSENRNFVPQAVKFDISDISANSADNSLFEPVRKFHPVESVAVEQKDFVMWWTTLKRVSNGHKRTGAGFFRSQQSLLK
jgi:hypothetical protein